LGRLEGWVFDLWCIKQGYGVTVHFCINSLAHYVGEATYSDQRSARDSYITALCTFGEGYHNFHHEFPYDYRNGVHTTAFDPGKWMVALLSYVGLTYNLRRFPEELFDKGKIQMAQKDLEKRKAKYFWGKAFNELPALTRAKVEQMAKENGDHIVIIDNTVYDLSSFEERHPGGTKILASYWGKDSTSAFNGGVYNHSFAARNVLDTLRVARIEE